MSETILKLRTRKWYLFVCYLILGYAIYGTIQNFEYVKDSPGLSFLLILFVILFLNMHRPQVIFEEDSVKRALFFFTISIPYNQVEKIKVTKNRIKIYGSKGVISFNNFFLLTDFKSAVQLLVSKINGPETVELTGKEKYIREYFQSR